MFTLSIIILCIAVINAFFQMIFKKPKTITREEHINDTIFVCIISYKDPLWIDYIENILNKAYCKNRIFIGVLEFVENATQSVQNNVPKNMRNQVRVKTMSSTLANTLANCRKTCLEHLYLNEKYVLYLRSATLCPNWDYILCDYKIHTKMVISTELPETTIHIFSTIKDYNKNTFTLTTNRKKIKMKQ